MTPRESKTMEEITDDQDTPAFVRQPNKQSDVDVPGVRVIRLGN